MLAKPFDKILDENDKPDLEQEHVGLVEDNNDPEKLMRVRVRIDPYESIDTDMLPWAFACPKDFLGTSPDSVDFCVPEVGSEVTVYFPTRDKDHPFYKGAPLNQDNRTTFFDEDYPNSYGKKDSAGNFTKVNKATGITVEQHSSTTNTTTLKDGSVTLSLPNGIVISAEVAGNKVAVSMPNGMSAIFDINSMTADITSPIINFHALASVSINTPLLDINATVTNITGAATNLNVATTNMSGLCNVAANVIAGGMVVGGVDVLAGEISGAHHIHNTPTGPSSPPLP
jgi:hypothetical protein